MSEREYVIEDVKDRMCRAFSKGDMADAANLERWLGTLEGMTDDGYLSLLYDEEEVPTA